MREREVYMKNGVYRERDRQKKKDIKKKQGEHPSVMVESYHIERTEQSHSRIRSHVSHDLETWKLQ